MNRIDLHDKLLEGLGSNRVYYQPPANLQIKYPCIVYSLVSLNSKFADNINYKLDTQYNIVYITKDPDDQFPFTIFDLLPTIKHVSTYVSDGLYHHKYSFYLNNLRR